MRITEIQIHNYRPYDSFRIEFPATKETDLHAVIASNGVGKTSLLNAIEWCLYEEEPHLGDDKSLPICNLDALQKAKSEGKPIETTSVLIKAEDGKDSFRFERTVKVHTDSFFPERPKLKVFVSKEGHSTEVLEDDAAIEVVNIYFPKKIKEHFFFDGEQLSGYFGRKDSNINVRSSIHEVAQISVVTLAKDHLNKTIKDIRDLIASKNPQTQSLIDDLNNHEIQIKALEDDNFTLEGQNNKASTEIKELDKKISNSEKAYNERDRFDKNSEELTRLDKLEEIENNKLYELAKRYYMPLMMYNINRNTYQFIEDKKQTGKLPPDIDIELITKSLHEHKCAVCGSDFNDNAEEHMKEILNRIRISSHASNKLMEIKNDVYRLANIVEKYAEEKKEIFKELKAINSRRKELETENKALQQGLLDDVTTSQVANWMLDKDRTEALVKNNNQKIGANKAGIDRLKNEKKDLEEKLRKARMEDAKCAELSAQLDFATDALNIVKEIESEIISDVKSKMEKETMDLFKQFIWKENTYGRIALSDNYQLELFSKEEDISCLGSCSAAETQLLAMAFTLALHKVSGRNAPLFIDTPVGRVSDKNRENFAKALVEVSRNKQIIMSFTPSEYSSEVSNYFDNALSSKRTLRLNNEKAVK